MKFSGIVFFFILSLPLTAVACPVGMQLHGSSCLPAGGGDYYTGWDLMRDRRAAIDAMGSDRAPVDYSKYLKTPEQMRELVEARKRREKEEENNRKEDEKKRQALADGIWNVDSKPTPEGKICAAVFSKYSYEYKEYKP